MSSNLNSYRTRAMRMGAIAESGGPVSVRHLHSNTSTRGLLIFEENRGYYIRNVGGGTRHLPLSSVVGIQDAQSLVGTVTILLKPLLNPEYEWEAVA